MINKILSIVNERPNLTIGEICEILDVRFDDVHAEFTDLIKQGYLLVKMVDKSDSRGRVNRTPVYTLGSKSFELNIIKNVSNNINDKVFLSHAFDDKRIANKFIDDILVNILGLSKEKDIFFTSHPDSGVEPSHNWRDEIKTNLKSKKIFIAIISERFKKSEMCLAEIGAAWILDKTVYQFAVTPIVKSKCSKVLNTNQAISLTFKDDIKSFIISIKNKLNIKELNKEIDDESINKFVRSINTTNFSIKKKLAPPKRFNFNDLEKSLHDEKFELPSFTYITEQNRRYKKINPNFLNYDSGTFMVWVEYNNDIQCNSYGYIVSHAGNKGIPIRKKSFDYPNVWAIRRVLNPRLGYQFWEFTCSNNNCESISIKSEKVLNKGPHLFTVSWNKSQKIIEFYIDQTREGYTEYKNWPEFLEPEMIIGTWPTKHPYHYFNSKIGKIKVLKDKNINSQFLDNEIREFNK